MRAALRTLLAAAVFAAATARADDYPQGLFREQLELAARGIEVDVSRMKPAELQQVEYVGRPVLVYRRTAAERAYLKTPADASLADPSGANMQASIQSAYASSASLVWARLLLVDQPALEKTPGRSLDEEFLVVAGWNPDPRSGCRLRLNPPAQRPKNIAAFSDACDKGEFDAAGRRIQEEGKPPAAAYNLYIPPHRFVEGNKIIVGLAPGMVPPRLEFSHASLYRGADPTYDLIIAARYDDARMVGTTLARGADINAFRPEDGSPLDAAIIGSRIDTVRLLIERGARPTGRSMRAAESIGRREVWELLENMARKEGSR